MEIKTKIPNAPKHLNKGGRKLWRGVLHDFEIEDTHDLKLLAEACACIDRIDEARREIEKAGPYFIDRWRQPKPHPAHAVEQANKTFLARLLRELNLDRILSYISMATHVIRLLDACRNWGYDCCMP